MRTIVIVIAVLAVASLAPAKSVNHTTAIQPGAGSRQGGDTLADAFVITSLPFSDTGTTVGYDADYDGFCAYPESGMAADVCYVYTSAAGDIVTIDLQGSDYDTTLLVFEVVEGDLEPVECNDDYYPDLTSRIDDLPLVAGSTYLIVVDGYGYETGNYVLSVTGTTVATDSATWSEVKAWYR